MKKTTLLALALLWLTANTVLAVPANPKAVSLQQPDGTTVTVVLHGDEWNHFTTTADGYTVVKNQQGYYVYAQRQQGQLAETALVAHDAKERTAEEAAFLAKTEKYLVPLQAEQTAQKKKLVEQRQRQTLSARRAARYDYSKFKGLIVLVEFNDKQFSRSDYKDIITDMVNKENYTGYGNQHYTGSVRDYFSDNSMGKFQPQFDVVGPYTVPYSQYDPQGSENAWEITLAALDQADADVDFTQYDGDGDGMVDMVYFIVAGNGANYGGNDSRLWWPHRSAVIDYANWSYVYKDGVIVYDYASSVELTGYTSYPSTVKIDGIGTICHEFSHVLGLPDLYDADYEQHGQSNDPGIWSVMAGGSYENDSRTPVGYSLFERWSAGFMDEDPVVIDGEGSYTLNPLYDCNTGFRINSPIDNEFFLFENRQKSAFKWDAYLPGSGMLVHRVDLTNESVWTQNRVNNNAERNYYEVVRAGGSKSNASAADLFPGSRNVKVLDYSTSPANLKTWSGKSTKWGLRNIAMAGGVVTFDIGNALVLTQLNLPATFSVGLGVSLQLEATSVPESAEYTLTWVTSDPAVATVNAEGYVKGVGLGTCTITATSDNGLSATCQVTVEPLEAIGLEAFCQLGEGVESLLRLDDAAVLYVYDNTAFVRQSEGCLMLSNMSLGLQRNDVVNGALYAKFSKENEMAQAVGIDGTTNADGLTVVAGSEVQPREMTVSELSEADYSDYVVVRGVRVIRVSGTKITDGTTSILMTNPFDAGSMPSKTTGKYFDVEGIVGTALQSNGQLALALYRTAITEVPNPTAISTLEADTAVEAPLYNLHGQRVDSHAKGLLIRNGKKLIVK